MKISITRIFNSYKLKTLSNTLIKHCSHIISGNKPENILISIAIDHQKDGFPSAKSSFDFLHFYSRN